MFPLFADRHDAGRQLARRLTSYRGRSDVLVLALPRGGVPVAVEVAAWLGVPLDLFPVRRLGVPNRPQLAMGAIAPGGARILNRTILRRFHVTAAAIAAATTAEISKLNRRELAYRGGRPPAPIAGRTVLLVDDGLATGATMRVAVESVRRQGAQRLGVAAPVASPEAWKACAAEADEVVCVATPVVFSSIGEWYEQFPPLTDPQVRAELLKAMPSDKPVIRVRPRSAATAD